jgi:hypothetical protein
MRLIAASADKENTGEDDYYYLDGLKPRATVPTAESSLSADGKS